MMMRNGLGQFLGVFLLFVSNCSYVSAVTFLELSPKEQIFVNRHQIKGRLKKKLDTIFAHIPKELQSLLSGEDVSTNREEILDLFKKSGFTVYMLVLPNEGVDRNAVRAWMRAIHAVVRHSSLPEFFLKIGFDRRYPRVCLSRIVVADFINHLLSYTQFGITGLAKIEKKLYHRPWRDWDLLDVNYVVLSPTINAKSLACLKNKRPCFFSERGKQAFENFRKTSGCVFLKNFFDGAWDCYNPCNFLIDDKKKLLYNVDSEPDINCNLNRVNLLMNQVIGKGLQNSPK